MSRLIALFLEFLALLLLSLGPKLAYHSHSAFPEEKDYSHEMLANVCSVFLRFRSAGKF